MTDHGRRCALLTLLVALAAGCRMQSETVVFVRSKAPADQRKVAAQAYVTEEKLATLRLRLKERVPAATESQLQGLYLKWKITSDDDQNCAAAIVGIQGQVGSTDLLLAAADLIESDINGPS